MAVLLLLLFPALAMAGIKIEIAEIGKFESENFLLGVYPSGSEDDVISDVERSTFHLKDDELEAAVTSYFGKRPSNAYLRSPTPWGDLYKTYDWPQVKRTLVAKSGNVSKVTSGPVIIKQQIFENNGTERATFNVGLTEYIKNNISSSWYKGGELSVGQEIKYEFAFQAMTAGSKAFSYMSSWGKDTEKTQLIKIGAKSGLEMMLQPGQSVMAELQVSRASMRCEVNYEASLSGDVAVNYDDTHNGHHFWSLDVEGVMRAGNANNKVPSKEFIDLVFYANPKVTVTDRSTGAKLLEAKF